MRDRIILVNLGKLWFGSTSKIIPPTSILPVAGMLDKHGYKVEIFDARLEDYHNLDLRNVLAVGITCMTGRSIKHGIEICRYVKEMDKDIIVIWGGIHASLLPEQTVSNPYVDIVVRGEGEIAMLELIKALEKDKPLEGIRGIVYKRNGKTVTNPERPFMNLDDTVDLAYHLVPKKYMEKYKPEEGFFYPDSRGCPHRCAYCYNAVFCHSTWRSKSADKIIEELRWIEEKFNPKQILFMVDNFFVNKKRVHELATRIIEEGFDFEWSADVRTNYFDNYDVEFLKLLRESGCKMLHAGAESGSPRVLDFIKKDITTEQTVNAVKMLKEAGIGTTLFFVIGFPTETREETLETLNFMDKLERINPDVKQIISVFSPYPGTMLFDLAVKEFNFRPPQSLDEWGNWMFSAEDNITWFDPKYRKFLIHVAQISRLKSSTFNFTTNVKDLLKEVGRLPFAISARWRWSNRFFAMPVEWEAWGLIQKWRGYF